MKARDIIANWPRGRSSSRPIRIPAWFRFAWYKSRMEAAGHPIFGPTDAAFEEFTRTNMILFFEAEAEAKYRAEQDRMTDAYRLEQFGEREFVRIFGRADITREEIEKLFPGKCEFPFDKLPRKIATAEAQQ